MERDSGAETGILLGIRFIAVRLADLVSFGLFR